MIISASVGAGHDGAARGLAESLTMRGCDVVRYDFLDLLPSTTGTWLNRLYEAQLRLMPASWGWLLRVLEQPSVTSFAATAAARAAQAGMAAVLTGAEDLIISTYPLASQTLSFLRAAGVVTAPTATFLCDTSVHPLWIAPGIDRHIAVHPAAAMQAVRLGAYGVTVCAPVVDPAFRPAAQVQRARARARWNLPSGPIALVVGGSWGVGQLYRAARDIAASGLATPVTVCGRNEALHRRLVTAGVGVALGWVDDMPDLLHAADVVVHNAGGLTCYEALASGVPVITYRTLPGHGAGNAAVMRDADLSPWPRDRAKLRGVLDAVLRANARTLPMPGSPAAETLYAMIAPMPVGVA